MEVHQEQGPVLEAADKPLGVVSAIAGQTRLSVSMIGTQVCSAVRLLHAASVSTTKACAQF